MAVVFARHGGDLARARNVRARPEATLLLDEYDADWRRLWWLRVDARATVIEGRNRSSDFDLAPVADALRAKYSQYDELPLFRGEPTALASHRVPGSELVRWARRSGGRVDRDR